MIEHLYILINGDTEIDGGQVIGHPHANSIRARAKDAFMRLGHAEKIEKVEWEFVELGEKPSWR